MSKELTWADIFRRWSGPTAMGQALGIDTRVAAVVIQRSTLSTRHWPRLIAYAEEQVEAGNTIWKDITAAALGELAVKAEKAKPERRKRRESVTN